MSEAQADIPRAVYVSPRQPNLKFALDVDGERVEFKFKHGRLELEGAALEAFEAAINNERAASLRNLVHKVTLAAAEAVVAEHMAANKGGAVKGPFDTSHRAQLLADEIRAGAKGMAHLTSEQQLKVHEEAVRDAIAPLEAPHLPPKRDANEVAAEAAKQAAEAEASEPEPAKPTAANLLGSFLAETPTSGDPGSE